ncbi:MAG: hypothetical protein COV67_08450 [Nitrospinae bacterium CG11_big_fil_rev_8_21_14_0_20_56_8]|nr:MAG: hypothetical protein COV67_08450 [Nitrospinae bacterium CG11_big_fil_rev_8_21_14_0_20_56_8]
MKPGDKIKFNFAGKQMEGVVHKVFPNSVYLKVDFERDKGKVVKRKLSALGQKKEIKKAEKKTPKPAESKKPKVKKEKKPATKADKKKDA